MKITFVYLGAESLSIEILSSVLRKNKHSTYLAFDPGLFAERQYLDMPFLARIFDYKKRLLKDIYNTQPDIVAFSVGTDIYQWACGIAEEIKKNSNVPIIFGGIHPTSVPERVIKNEFVDMLCIGEGEESIVEIANQLEGGKLSYDIKNIWFKKNGEVIRNDTRPLIQELDSLPFPDKSLFEDHVLMKNGRYMIMTSRGCPYDCTYCYNNVLRNMYSGKGKYVRQRSIENVIAELKQMKKRYNFSGVDFMDDLFVMNKKWLREFVPEYKKEIGLPYDCMTHTPAIDYDTALLLKESGCHRIKFGVQTMNEETRHEILKRPFEKTEYIERALNICDKFGIGYSLDHIIGIPGETHKDWLDTAEFYSQTGAERVCCYSLYYYPKTEIIQKALSQNILEKKDVEKIEDGKCPIYTYGSSLIGKDLKTFFAFRKFYALVKIFPKSLMRFFLKPLIFPVFFFLPKAIFLVFEFMASLKTGHLRGLDFVKYYMFHLKRRFAR